MQNLKAENLDQNEVSGVQNLRFDASLGPFSKSCFFHALRTPKSSFSCWFMAMSKSLVFKWFESQKREPRISKSAFGPQFLASLR